MSSLIKGKVCGAITVGEKGQVVIPIGIRRLFNIKPGDKLIVFTKPDNIGLIPAEGLTQLLNEVI